MADRTQPTLHTTILILFGFLSLATQQEIKPNFFKTPTAEIYFHKYHQNREILDKLGSETLGSYEEKSSSKKDSYVVNIPSSEELENVPVVTLRFNTRSVPINIMQQYQSKIQRGQGTQNTRAPLKTIENPDLLLHMVTKPIIQEVREVIQPYRKVVQIVEPVQEQQETVIASSEHREVDPRNLVENNNAQESEPFSWYGPSEHLSSSDTELSKIITNLIVQDQRNAGNSIGSIQIRVQSSEKTNQNLTNQPSPLDPTKVNNNNQTNHLGQNMDNLVNYPMQLSNDSTNSLVPLSSKLSTLYTIAYQSGPRVDQRLNRPISTSAYVVEDRNQTQGQNNSLLLRNRPMFDKYIDSGENFLLSDDHEDSMTGPENPPDDYSEDTTDLAEEGARGAAIGTTETREPEPIEKIQEEEEELTGQSAINDNGLILDEETIVYDEILDLARSFNLTTTKTNETILINNNSNSNNITSTEP